MNEISEQGKKVLESLNSPIVQALSDQGITPTYLAKLLKDELKAKQIKVFQDKGKVIYSDPIEALDIQQRARMDAHKLLDHYPKEKIEIESTIFKVINYAKKDDKDDKGEIHKP